MKLKKWLFVTLKEEVLNILDGLADHFKNAQGKPDWRKVVEVFDQFCEGSPLFPPQEQKIVNEVIEALKLTNKVNELRAFWQNIPAPIRDVTTSLQNHTAPIVWELTGQGGKGFDWGNLKGPLGSIISFAGNVNLALSLQALNSNTVIRSAGLTLGEGERFLDIGMSGKLEIEPGGNIKLGFVGIKGSGQAVGSLDLNYYFIDKACWLFAEALIHNIPHLASPFDAADIAAEKSHRLSALHLNIIGNLTASLDFKAGKTWGTTFNLKDRALNLDNTVSIGAAISADLHSDLTIKGGWNVVVKPLDKQILNVSIQKDVSKKKNSGFSLNADVGINGLDQVGNALINKYLPDAAPLLSQLQEFSNFGTLLKNDLKKRLLQLWESKGDNTFKQELASVLVGEDNTEALADTLADAAENALNNRLNLLEGKAMDAGEKLLQDIAGHLKLPDHLGEKLVDKIQGQLSKILGNIKYRLENRLQQIIAQYQGKLESIFKPLGAVGKVVSDFSADVNKVASQLLEPVIEFLTKYQQERNKIVRVIQASANLKLSLYISRTFSSTKDDSSILEFRLDSSIPEARQLYKEMITGKFNNAMDAARKDKDGSKGIQLTGGSFKNTLSDNITTNFSFNIFGARITAETIMKSQVQIQLDTAGNIMIADSTDTMEKTFSAFGKSWDVKFINMLEIPGTVPAGEVSDSSNTSKDTRILSTSLSLSYQDDDLKKDELRSFFGSLLEADLIPSSVLNAVNKRYEEISTRSSHKKIGAKIDSSLILTSGNIEKLISNQDNDIQQIAINSQVAIFFRDAKKYEEFQEVVGQWYDRTGSVQEQIEKIAATGSLGEALIRYDISNISEFRNQDTVPIPVRHYLDLAFQIGTNAANLVNIIRDIRLAARMPVDIEDREEDVKTLNEYNRATNKSLKKWLKIGGILESIGLKKERVPSSTLAFFATIGKLCRLGQEGTKFLTPTITWPTEDRPEYETYV